MFWLSKDTLCYCHYCYYYNSKFSCSNNQYYVDLNNLTRCFDFLQSSLQGSTKDFGKKSKCQVKFLISILAVRMRKFAIIIIIFQLRMTDSLFINYYYYYYYYYYIIIITIIIIIIIITIINTTIIDVFVELGLE